MSQITFQDFQKLAEAHSAFLNQSRMEHLKELNLKAFERLMSLPQLKATSDLLTYVNLKRFEGFALPLDHIEPQNGPSFHIRGIETMPLSQDPKWLDWVKSQKHKISIETDPQVLWTLAFLSQVWVLQIPQNSADLQIEIEWLSHRENGENLAFWIQAQAGSSATIAFDFESTSTDVHAFMDIQVAANAHLKIDNCLKGSEQNRLLLTQKVEVSGGGRIDLIGADLGGYLNRQVQRIDLLAPLAHAEIHGVSATHLNEESHRHLTLRHIAPHTTSNQKFHQVALGESTQSTDGLVWVGVGALEANSDQLLRSILLSPKARVAGKPTLKIDCADVKCSHGNTCGELDSEELFYLESRGLSKVKAREVLISAFVEEILQEIKSPELRQKFEVATLSKLGV